LNPLVVQVDTAFESLSVYLKASTRGEKSVVKQFNIDVGQDHMNWAAGKGVHQSVDVNDNDSNLLTRFELPTFIPAYSGCSLLNNKALED
jgi:hypothetical protein